MSSKTESVTWSRDTGQWIACFDSCQLTITWMCNIKDEPMVMVLGLRFSDVRTYGHTSANQILEIDRLPNF